MFDRMRPPHRVPDPIPPPPAPAGPPPPVGPDSWDGIETTIQQCDADYYADFVALYSDPDPSPAAAAAAPPLPERRGGGSDYYDDLASSLLPGSEPRIPPPPVVVAPPPTAAAAGEAAGASAENRTEMRMYQDVLSVLECQGPPRRPDGRAAALVSDASSAGGGEGEEDSDASSSSAGGDGGGGAAAPGYSGGLLALPRKATAPCGQDVFYVGNGMAGDAGDPFGAVGFNDCVSPGLSVGNIARARSDDPASEIKGVGGTTTENKRKRSVQEFSKGARPSEGVKKVKQEARPETAPPRSPQHYLNELLASRGYPTATHSARDCGLHIEPSQLQLASYGTAVLRAVQRGDPSALSTLLSSGLSPNPCNKFSEGTLAMACKRGRHDLFLCQVRAGATVDVADDFSRTPLHHAAWAGRPSFETVEAILDMNDTMLRITDRRGLTPLEYLTKDKWGEWIAFLESKADVYWPERGGEGRSKAGEVPRAVPAGGTERPTSPPDPENALPVELAALVASGRIRPEEAARMGGGERDNADAAAASGDGTGTKFSWAGKAVHLSAPPPRAALTEKLASGEAQRHLASGGTPFGLFR